MVCIVVSYAKNFAKSAQKSKLNFAGPRPTYSPRYIIAPNEILTRNVFYRQFLFRRLRDYFNPLGLESADILPVRIQHLAV